jgi:hypothetical protein
MYIFPDQTELLITGKTFIPNHNRKGNKRRRRRRQTNDTLVYLGPIRH